MPPEQPQIAGLRDRVLWNRWSIVGIRQTLGRSEEHTSELQSQSNLVCRLLLEKKTTNLLTFIRASIKMIGVSNLQSFIASMTQKLTLSDISDESKNYLDKAGITTACLRIKSKWTAGGK